MMGFALLCLLLLLITVKFVEPVRSQFYVDVTEKVRGADQGFMKNQDINVCAKV